MQLFASISKALGTGSWQWPSAPTAYRCHASGKLATGRRNSRDCRQVRRTDSPAALQVIARSPAAASAETPLAVTLVTILPQWATLALKGAAQLSVTQPRSRDAARRAQVFVGIDLEVKEDAISAV